MKKKNSRFNSNKIWKKINDISCVGFSRKFVRIYSRHLFDYGGSMHLLRESSFNMTRGEMKILKLKAWNFLAAPLTSRSIF